MVARVSRDQRLEVEFVADLACPWCYIGWRRLEQAAALRPAIVVKPIWRPFLLNPHLPEDGMDRSEYVRAKFGGEAAARRIYERIATAGREAGIDFRFDRMARTPNTVHAQRLILFAQARHRERPLVEGLFRALFEDGRDIGSIDELVGVAAAAGLDAGAARRLLEGEDLVEAVLQAHVLAERRGIRGVPVFVVGGRQAISGAQPPEVLATLLDVAITPPREWSRASVA
jgi:predicted DsbA family dithiol-disulfide isomerase